MVNGIEITEVVIYPIKKPFPESYVSGYARVVLNDQLIINGLRIVKRKTGYFIGFPQEFNRAIEQSYDIVCPITLQMRKYIQEKVLQLWTPTKEEV